MLRCFDFESGVPPGIHTAGQRFDVGEALRTILFHPTGGRGFFRSSAVEDDFLILRDAILARFEFGKRNCAFQVIVPELLFAVVSTDEE